MFKIFFLSEIKLAFQKPMVYVLLGLMTLLVFGATASDNVTIGGSVGNVLRNSPHIITVFTTIMGIFGLLFATAFFNNAALKDHIHGFNEIIFSAPISKSGYFFGRFFGALVLACIPMLGVFLGIILGTYLSQFFGWIPAERFGKFYYSAFVNNFFLFILPNMFFAGSIIYALANKWRSTVISFVGAMVVIVGYIVAGSFLSDLDSETIAALSDTFGIRAYSLHSKYFTAVEKNSVSPSFSGLLLVNRLIWIGAGFIILMTSYFSFSFKTKNKKVQVVKNDVSTAKETSFAVPNFNYYFNRNTSWLQFKSFFHINFLSITKSVTFKILFLFSAIILISNLWGGFEYYGLKVYPRTYKIIGTIGEATGIFTMIILVFFSGELIWRDKESKISEVVDATPHTSLISMLAKSLSLISIAIIFHLFFILVGILYQLISGFQEIEINLFFRDLVYNNLVPFCLYASLALLIQVLVKNKYLGYFITILVIFISDIILSIMEVQTNLLSFAGKPNLQYSDLNDFGPGLQGAIWFNWYWFFFTGICILLAGIFWKRGLVTSFKDRLKLAKKQTTKPTYVTAGILGIIWITLGSFIFYNTQILNSYKSKKERVQTAVEYENKYKKYEGTPTPKIMDAKYTIDIYPEARDVFVRGNFILKNTTSQPIDSIHFTTNDDWKSEIKIDNASLILNDTILSYQIYKLGQTLMPNDSINLVIDTKFITKGFKNDRGSTQVVKNGTFLNNFQILPIMGYNNNRELSDKHKRKKHDLKPKNRMPKLEENCNKNCLSNYLTNGLSDFINIETYISTSNDQIAIAPGSLLKQWEKDGRNYYHYKVDHPSQNFYSFVSGRYEIAKRKWNEVDIEVYYDKKHSVNIEMMLDAVERSLEYYTENFGPYYHKQCRIIEFPRYATFAQAFPGTMPYSEGFGFVVNLEDENKNNVIDAVIAHEMAHQWWAHQLLGANMQGGTLLSESFSEYSSLMTMKSIAKKPMQMRDFLKHNHNRYLRGRGQEMEKELPLYTVENQGYIHYGKGSIILYALQDYIGEDKVNLALKNFLDAFKYQSDPYPTSHDFLGYLTPQVPDSLQYLIEDWFKSITLYDNRLIDATFVETEMGKYEVTVDIESYKIKADSIGNEMKVAMNDWVDIGFFSDKDEKELFFQKRVKINKNKTSFTFLLDEKPVKAGIDPRRLLIDRVFKDNIKVVGSQSR